jgi:hypothetical protein
MRDTITLWVTPSVAIFRAQLGYLSRSATQATYATAGGGPGAAAGPDPFGVGSPEQ